MNEETLVCEPSKSSPASAPALVDRATGASVMLAQFATFNLSFARGEVGESRAAYDDLIGPNIGAVMARVGWHYDGSTMRVDAFLPAAGPAGSQSSRIVASGWAGPIRATDGSLGINVSYGVGAGHRGAGFGRLLAYCAVAECLAHQALTGEPIPTFVNIQARATNGASLAVARSLGVPTCESAAFAVPANGDRIDYVGFREPIQDFLPRGLVHTRARLPDYDPGSFAAARMGLISDLSAGLDLLGWLEDSTFDAKMNTVPSMNRKGFIPAADLSPPGSASVDWHVGKQPATMQTTLEPLAPLSLLIAARIESIGAAFAPRADGSLPYPDGDSDGAAVLRRQHSLLADIQAAVTQGVTVLDFAYEGEFDPVEASIMPAGETAFERKQALHEIALAGIEPVITAARAAGITIHAPELGLPDEAPADVEPLIDRLGG